MNLHLYIGHAETGERRDFTIRHITIDGKCENIAFIFIKLLHGRKHPAVFFTHHRARLRVVLRMRLLSGKRGFASLFAVPVDDGISGNSVQQGGVGLAIAVLFQAARKALLQDVACKMIIPRASDKVGK